LQVSSFAGAPQGVDYLLLFLWTPELQIGNTGNHIRTTIVGDNNTHNTITRSGNIHWREMQTYSGLFTFVGGSNVIRVTGLWTINPLPANWFIRAHLYVFDDDGNVLLDFTTDTSAVNTSNFDFTITIAASSGDPFTRFAYGIEFRTSAGPIVGAYANLSNMTFTVNSIANITIAADDYFWNVSDLTDLIPDAGDADAFKEQYAKCSRFSFPCMSARIFTTTQLNEEGGTWYAGQFYSGDERKLTTDPLQLIQEITKMVDRSMTMPNLPNSGMHWSYRPETIQEIQFSAPVLKAADQKEPAFLLYVYQKTSPTQSIALNLDLKLHWELNTSDRSVPQLFAPMTDMPLWQLYFMLCDEVEMNPIRDNPTHLEKIWSKAKSIVSDPRFRALAKQVLGTTGMLLAGAI